MTIADLELINGYIPTEKQLLAHNSKAKFVLFGGGVGGGKSVWLCNHVIHHCLSFPGSKALISRKYFSDTEKTTFQTLVFWLPKRHIRKFDSHSVVFKNGSTILLAGTGEGKDLKKLSGIEISIAALEQADEVPEEAFSILTTRLRFQPKKSPVPVFFQCICTANPGPSWVRERWLDKALPNHQFIQSLPTDNPHLPADYVESLKLSLSPDLFHSLVEGDFYGLSCVGGLFEKEKIEQAMARKPKEFGQPVYGVDVGKGTEETVLVKYCGNRIVIEDAFLESDLSKAGRRIAKKIQERKADIRVDGIGIGAGLAAVLRELGFVNVFEIIGSEKALNKRFSNLKTENYFNLRENLGRLSLPYDQILKTQMLNVRERKLEGRQAIESRRELAARGCSCPNRLDAVVLSLSGITVGSDDSVPIVAHHPLSQFRLLLGMPFELLQKMAVAAEIRKSKMTTKEEQQRQIERGFYTAGVDPRFIKDAIETKRKIFDAKSREEDETFLRLSKLQQRIKRIK